METHPQHRPGNEAVVCKAEEEEEEEEEVEEQEGDQGVVVEGHQ